MIAELISAIVWAVLSSIEVLWEERLSPRFARLRYAALGVGASSVLLFIGAVFTGWNLLGIPSLLGALATIVLCVVLAVEHQKEKRGRVGQHSN